MTFPFFFFEPPKPPEDTRKVGMSGNVKNPNGPKGLTVTKRELVYFRKLEFQQSVTVFVDLGFFGPPKNPKVHTPDSPACGDRWLITFSNIRANVIWIGWLIRWHALSTCFEPLADIVGPLGVSEAGGALSGGANSSPQPRDDGAPLDRLDPPISNTPPRRLAIALFTATTCERAVLSAPSKSEPVHPASCLQLIFWLRQNLHLHSWWTEGCWVMTKVEERGAALDGTVLCCCRIELVSSFDPRTFFQTVWAMAPDMYVGCFFSCGLRHCDALRVRYPWEEPYAAHWLQEVTTRINSRIWELSLFLTWHTGGEWRYVDLILMTSLSRANEWSIWCESWLSEGLVLQYGGVMADKGT